MNLAGAFRSRGGLATLALAGVAIAAIAAVATWRIEAGPAVDAYAVERADLTQTVVASGHVQSPRRVDIGVPVVGTVASIPVAEGQHVAAGQLLIALDAAESRANVEQARSALAQAEGRLAQMRATALPVAVESLRQAELNLANAERALARSRDLFARGFVGQAALDEAQRSRDVAASQAQSARLQRESQSEGGADERLARAALDQARATLAAAQARLDNITIEAPVAGVLISRDVEAGSVVQPGKALMVLSPDGATELVVQIDEKNLSLLAVGQKALASADAYPERRFDAEVAYINPAVDPSRGSVEVRLAVRQPPAYLLQDMTVSVDIEVARVAGALTLPTDAIRDGGWVLVAREGRARRQPVKIGARGEGRVQVSEGLKEGELVLPAVAAAVHDGAAVRAAAGAAKSPPRRT
jgi:HlyD family secretion protein